MRRKAVTEGEVGKSSTDDGGALDPGTERVYSGPMIDENTGGESMKQVNEGELNGWLDSVLFDRRLPWQTRCLAVEAFAQSETVAEARSVFRRLRKLQSKAVVDLGVALDER